MKFRLVGALTILTLLVGILGISITAAAGVGLDDPPAAPSRQPETARGARPVAGTLPVGSHPTLNGEGLLYLTSLNIGDTTFAVYNPTTDAWTTLTPYETGCQMAMTGSDQLYAYGYNTGTIDLYNPATDSWTPVIAAPPGASGQYCNLEITNEGEFLYTQANGTDLWYTSGGAWNTLALPFTTNVMGDYDPTTDQFVIGEYGTTHSHLIDVHTWAITDFSSPVGNGEYARFSVVLDNRYYFEAGGSNVHSFDLGNPALPPLDHGVSPGYYTSAAANRVNAVIFVASLDSTQLSLFDPATNSVTPLTGYGVTAGHSSVAFVQQYYGFLDGYVYDADTGGPIEGATVTAVPTAGGASPVATTDPSGYYTMTVEIGTYDVTAEKPGYLAQTVAGIEILSGAVTSQDFQLQYVGLWSPGPSQAPFEYNRFDGVFDPHDKLIYFLGGRTGGATHDKSIWTYDPLNDNWADTGCDMLYNAANITLALIENDGTGRGEALYVVGGYDVVAAANINNVQRYYPAEPGCVVEDVATDPYPDTDPSTLRPVGASGVAVVGGKIYVFGGWDSLTPYFSGKTWVFDPLASAGSRWSQIVSASLSPARAYPSTAVQGGLIYAMGGHSGYVTGLIPTDAVEVFDPANPGAGWNSLSNLPVATAEGRGFGFETDTLGASQQAGKIYVAGGGEWPDQSAAVFEYDVATDSWSQAFPQLIAARRNHAGVYVPICTPDPSDGLPGMWVFGGRISTDEPPYGDPEFYPFGCGALISYLPLAAKNYPFGWDTYYEPNNDFVHAYGPVSSAKNYLAYPDDENDYYYFTLSSAGTVDIVVSDYVPTSSNGDLVIRDEAFQFVKSFGEPGHTEMRIEDLALGAGKYYVHVYTASSFSNSQLYTLRVTY